MSVATTIETKLRNELQPSHLVVRDVSSQHEGHSGWRPGGETHFEVEVTAGAFAGLSRVAMQRQVYSILSDELSGPVHALSLKLASS